MSCPARHPHPYHLWEDYLAGMYDQSVTPDLHVVMARDLLGTPGDLGAAMRAAAARWPIAAEHRLTASDTNRQAWLGAAACFIVGRCPEHTTRSGWWRLTAGQQRAANGQADTVIEEWEADYNGIMPLFRLATRFEETGNV